MNCKFCYRPITEAILAEKRRRKIENALASVDKRIANGNLPGPKRRRDDEKILELRKQGLSTRAIAAKIGMSHGTVATALKEFRHNGTAQK